MYYMYTLTAIPVVAYEKMEQLLFSYEHHESVKKTLHRPSTGLHKFAYGCNFTDQLDYMYCVNVRSVHLVMTWFSTMKKKRERETFKIEKKIVFFFKNSYLK